ncbi:MAG: TIGR02147 family protein [Myxococcales bacterium]|nr:TIGR02147 family protein [Myxococcales bacterium]
MNEQRPNVFEHRDYRGYLRAFYGHRKRAEYGFSLRAFSRQAGLRSSNYLKLVMDGDRNLSPEMAARFAQTCGLRGEAADYFCELVSFNQARSAAERDRAYARIKRFRGYRKVYKLDKAQEAYHSRWYIPAVRELVAARGFREDPRWIARTLRPTISPGEAKHALDVLLELALLERGSDGRLRQCAPLVETPEGPLSHHLVTFHRAMMQRAAEARGAVPRERREIASLPLCLSDAQAAALKLELERFREELLQRYQSGGDACRVVQLNLQMFPLSDAVSQSEEEE